MTDTNKHRLLSRRLGWEEVREPYGYTNCAGFVWANGRTAILAEAEWTKLLREDGYTTIPEQKVVAGDLALYRDKTAGFLHVAQVFRRNELGVLMVLSKFPGCGEFLHQVLNVPYADENQFDLQTSFATKRPIP